MWRRRSKEFNILVGELNEIRALLVEVEDAVEDLPYISALSAGINTTYNGGDANAVANSRLLKLLMGDAASSGRMLWLDFSYAEFGEPIDFQTPLVGLRMEGNGDSAGAYGGTTLAWVGPPFQVDAFSGQQVPSSFFRFVNARQILLKGFQISCRRPLGRAFHSVAWRSEDPPAFKQRYEYITIDGVNGSLLTGWLFDKANDESDINNDHMYFFQCSALNMGRGQAHSFAYEGLRSAGWEMTHPQSRVHTMHNCEASQTGYQSIFAGLNYGVICDSFNWYGGAFNRLDACFLQQLNSDPIYVTGANAESNRALFLSTNGNNFSGLPVKFDSCRFAGNMMEDGDVLIRLPNSGPLEVRNCVLDGPHDRAIIPIQFGPGKHSELKTVASCIVENNIFRTTVPPEECIQFPYDTAHSGEQGYDPGYTITGNKVDAIGEDGLQGFFPITDGHRQATIQL